MNMPYNTPKVLHIGILFFFLLLLSGCITLMTTSRVIQEEDIVKGTTRMQFRHLGSNISKNTSYFSMSQVVVIEQKSGERERVNIYDFLTTSGSSYRMDQKVFLIIDGEVSPLNIQTTEYDYVKSISENTDEVATSDSTSVTVVTGITENNNKVTRFHYTFSSEILKKIKPSKEVLFRYYSGPHMYTIKMRKSAHKKLIKMLGRVE